MTEFQFVTNEHKKIVSAGCALTALAGVDCSSMEEADGRLLLHAVDMVHNGAKSVVIRATDTDVVVLAVSFFPELRAKGLCELWVQYGTGDSNMRYGHFLKGLRG